VDVFLTHTQAAHPTLLGTTAEARTAIEAQIRHLAAFIRANRDTVSPAILFGDFNVDWFAHKDLYDYLRSTLGNPLDLSPVIELDGRLRPSATSESDDGDISSFHASHPTRPADDAQRFGATAERLDYIFGFPGLLYAHHAARSRVVVEQWAPGRDMSDHYGVEAFIDTTAELFPSERDIQTLRVRLVQFQCLKTTSGFGDDEVKFSLSVKGASGVAASQSTAEIEDVTDGTVHGFDLPSLVLGDPGEEVDIAVEGWEIDSLSADDSLGRSIVTYGRDELLAIADRGALLTALPMLRGDGSEYVVQLEISMP
jgi:hypothetical protein